MMLSSSKRMRSVYCGNCGKVGHIYKHCNEPVISLGIILYRCTERGREYLMVMRKDSLGYVELIRGNYPLDDLEYLHNIFEEMTVLEKHRILHEDFTTLWNDLWVEDEEKKVKYQKEYYHSMKKFELLQEGVDIDGSTITLDNLIRESTSTWPEPEWGFPKGRRNIKERDIQCAIREFEEETDIDQDRIYVMRCIPPMVETFIGSNKKAYRHVYYLAKMLDSQFEPKINLEKKIQVIEIGDLRWFSLEDALDHIRVYNEEKKDALRDADRVLNLLEDSTIL